MINTLQIEHNKFKKPNWQATDQLAICKGDWEFELWTIKETTSPNHQNGIWTQDLQIQHLNHSATLLPTSAWHYSTSTWGSWQLKENNKTCLSVKMRAVTTVSSCWGLGDQKTLQLLWYTLELRGRAGGKPNKGEISSEKTPPRSHTTGNS